MGLLLKGNVNFLKLNAKKVKSTRASVIEMAEGVVLVAIVVFSK